MLGRRSLMACVFVAFATPALAQQWEEVFSEKNASGARYYFDRNISRSGKGSINTQYMVAEKQNQERISGGPAKPYNTVVYAANIDCSTRTWGFSHRTYYLNDSVQFSERVDSGKRLPAPAAGTAPFKITEKACALR
jgi:hypothetical protein